MKQTSFPGKE